MFVISREEFERAASVVPTGLQYSLLEVTAAAGTASEGLLRRRVGLEEATLRAEIEGLRKDGLIRRTEGPGYFARKLPEVRAESFWTMTAAGWENPNTPDTGGFAGGVDDADESVPRRMRPSPARARVVLFLGEFRGWRLAHEPEYMHECLSCGEDTCLEEDLRGKLWKIHRHPQPLDAACMSGSRVPPRLSRKVFRALRLSAPLRAFEAATEGLRSGYCPNCGGAIDHFCYRHHADNSVGAIGYQ